MLGRFTNRQAAAPEPDLQPEIEAPSFVSPVPELTPDLPQDDNPLLTAKLLDAKVRLHRRLIEEINLSALEKLPPEEMKKQILALSKVFGNVAFRMRLFLV